MAIQGPFKLLELMQRAFGKRFVNQIVGTKANVVKPQKFDVNAPTKSMYSPKAFDNDKTFDLIESQLMEYAPFQLSNRNTQEVANYQANLEMYLNARNKKAGGSTEFFQEESAGDVIDLKTKSKVTMSFLGMLIAHLGIAVFVLGATVTTQLGVEKDIKMTIGETQTIAGYDFVFNGVNPHSKDNYSGFIGDISVSRNNKKVTQLKPEKRLYQTGMPMTEASIDPSLTRDLYVALGESLEGGAWSVRIYYKPLVRWIWLGGLMIALGALLAAVDRRYLMRVKS